MAITFNTASTKASAADGTSTSWSHTSDGNPLIVRVALQGGVSNVAVTYNGVSVPLVVENLYSSFWYVGIFYLDAPASGSNTVAVSWTGSAGYTMSAVNVAGGGAPINTATGGANANSVSVNVTSATGDVVIDAVARRGAVALTVGASQTENFANLYGSGGSQIAHGGSYEAGAGTVTMSWSAGSANEWSIVACNLPAVSTATAQVIWFS